jgi:hypothetical protein
LVRTATIAMEWASRVSVLRLWRVSKSRTRAASFGRDVEDLLAGLEQPLGKRPAGAVGSLDRPEAIGPGLRVAPHRCVAGLVGAEPTSAEQLLVSVDDLDRGRQLVGINPDDHLRHHTSPSNTSDR